MRISEILIGFNYSRKIYLANSTEQYNNILQQYTQFRNNLEISAEQLKGPDWQGRGGLIEKRIRHLLSPQNILKNKKTLCR